MVGWGGSQSAGNPLPMMTSPHRDISASTSSSHGDVRATRGHQHRSSLLVIVIRLSFFSTITNHTYSFVTYSICLGV